MTARIHIFVYGMVHGVFFRANTVGIARKLRLKGWVRNRRDGSVEIVAEGDKEKLMELLEWCKIGPEGAIVERVDHRWEKPTFELKDFTASETV